MEIYDQNNKFIPASFTKRLLAGIIDFLIIFLLTYLGKIITLVKLPGLETTCSLYYFLCLIQIRTTIGGKILNIQTIRNNGDNNLSKMRSILKSTFIFLFLLVGIIVWNINFALPDSSFLIEPTLGLIFVTILFISLPMIFNKNKRSVTDILSGTRVVYRRSMKVRAFGRHVVN